MRAARVAILASGLFIAGWAASAGVSAQVAQGAPPPAAPPQSGRAAAPIDITGTWVQVVTEDWQWRFITPAVGDYTSVPLTAEADKLARAWNPAADAKAGLQCKPFGAAAIMRLPTRMQIAWMNDNTLRFDWDQGTQTRLAYFDPGQRPGARSWQGHAVVEWIDLAPAGRGGRGGAAPAPAAAPAGRGGAPAMRPGGLKMVTTNLRAQYLRMNGVPISEDAKVTEYLDIVPSPAGDHWLIVRTMVEDPQFLSQPYITSQHFRKEPDASKWSPTACELFPRATGSATQVPGGG